MGHEDTHQFDQYHTRELPRTTAVRQTRRLIVLVVGGSLLTLGLLLAVLPGPGIPFILLGLTVLSWEFRWAKRRLVHLKMKVKRLRRRLASER